jgi:hypothetical protein
VAFNAGLRICLPTDEEHRQQRAPPPLPDRRTGPSHQYQRGLAWRGPAGRLDGEGLLNANLLDAELDGEGFLSVDLLDAELDGEGLLGMDLLGASRACSMQTSDFSFNANTNECGLLYGSSCFRDKGGREENGWTGEKGKDISGEKRLGFGERRVRVDMSRHKRRYFTRPLEQLAIMCFLSVVLSNRHEK